MTFGLRISVVLAFCALVALPAFPHRLDEYLQATFVFVGKTQVEMQMTLTPGVAVFPKVMAEIDADGNGVISEAEQYVYAARVLRDLSFRIDGHPLIARVTSVQFPAVKEMQDGLGEIELDFSADLPRGGRNRKLTIENHHLSGISVYLTNSVVPQDPELQIAAQKRNYTQSVYELDYVGAGVARDPLAGWWWVVWPGTGLLLLMSWVTLRWPPRRRRGALLSSSI
jgi:hypothetical protein